MRHLFSAIFLLLALPAQAGPDNSFLGDWYGVGVQSDGGEWDMVLSIKPDMATIAYPSLGCGGFWAYTDVLPDSLSGVEYIVHGLDNCINQGNVRVRHLGDGQLLFYWCDAALDISATAILQHPDDGKTSYEEHFEQTRQAILRLGDSLSLIDCSSQGFLGS